MQDDVDRAGAEHNEAPIAPRWRHGRLLPTNRFDAFSDGVFAIAITLLVLELHVPDVKEGFLHELGAEWHTYACYLVSFAFIGGTWIAHANLTRFIKGTDAALMRLNLLLLLFVSLLPFTTSLMAAHVDGTAKRVVVLLFGLDLILATLMIDLVIRHAARTAGIADDELAEEELRAFARERQIALISLAAATVIGVLLPRVGIFTFLVVSVVFLFEPLWRVSWLGRRTTKA